MTVTGVCLLCCSMLLCPASTPPSPNVHPAHLAPAADVCAQSEADEIAEECRLAALA